MLLVDYHVLHQPNLPPYAAALYDYLVAGNGVFLRSQRPGLRVLLPITSCEIRGLPPVAASVQFDFPRIPACVLEQILVRAQAAGDAEGRPVEMLFHLYWRHGEWQLVIPEQQQTTASVTPCDDGPDSSYAQALVELHSHHDLDAFFSTTDDRDEQQGFRIYAVIGHVHAQPELLVRVGCEGAFLIIPAEQIFELPGSIVDASTARRHQQWADDQDENEGACVL